MRLHRAMENGAAILASVFSFWVGAVASAQPAVQMVEPYLAGWCAKQFPKNLTFDGYDMMAMMTSHKHILVEPFVGEWCFDQFKSELSSLNRDDEIFDLYTNHAQLEDFLRVWAMDSSTRMASALRVSDNLWRYYDKVPVEPYLAEWCAAQYPEQLSAAVGTTPELVERFVKHHIAFEPAVARWCFAQFPKETSDYHEKEEQVLIDLYDQHEAIENWLMQWAFAVIAADEESQQLKAQKAKQQYTALICVSVALAASWIGFLWFACCRRRTVASSMAEEGVVFEPDKKVSELTEIA